LNHIIRYLATSVAPLGDAASRTATLVRGVDTFHPFEPDPVPTRDIDPAVLEGCDMKLSDDLLRFRKS
jgi:hypothetical protein